MRFVFSSLIAATSFGFVLISHNYFPTWKEASLLLLRGR